MTTLIVLSHVRWNFVHARPQHLMSHLADDHPVVFVEEPVCDEAGTAHLAVREPRPGVRVITPHIPARAAGFDDDALSLVRPLLQRWLREQSIDDVVLWCYTPAAWPLAEGLAPRLVVYDCMDEIPAGQEALRRREAALLDAADLVFTPGPSLFEARRALHPAVHCLPNAVDAAHFAPRLDPDPERARAEALQQRIGRPRLGYFGVIDERVDLALIDAVARERPDWQLVMVGPVVNLQPARLPRRENLHWLGLQPYERLPHLMAAWDVCLIPFASNEATCRASPAQTLEYLAGEKPVVSTRVPDVVGLYGDMVELVRGPAEFVSACERLLGEPRRARAERIARSTVAVHRSSWRRLAETVNRLLVEQLLYRSARSRVAGAETPGPASVPLAEAMS